MYKNHHNRWIRSYMLVPNKTGKLIKLKVRELFELHRPIYFGKI